MEFSILGVPVKIDFSPPDLRFMLTEEDDELIEAFERADAGEGTDEEFIALADQISERGLVRSSTEEGGWRKKWVRSE